MQGDFWMSAEEAAGYMRDTERENDHWAALSASFTLKIQKNEKMTLVKGYND